VVKAQRDEAEDRKPDTHELRGEIPSLHG
jgi:hypothetical protein